MRAEYLPGKLHGNRYSAIACPDKRKAGSQYETRLQLPMRNRNRIPGLQDRIIHRNRPRVPESPDLNPRVASDRAKIRRDEAQGVQLTVRRRCTSL